MARKLDLPVTYTVPTPSGGRLDVGPGLVDASLIDPRWVEAHAHFLVTESADEAAPPTATEDAPAAEPAPVQPKERATRKTPKRR